MTHHRSTRIFIKKWNLKLKKDCWVSYSKWENEKKFKKISECTTMSHSYGDRWNSFSKVHGRSYRWERVKK